MNSYICLIWIFLFDTDQAQISSVNRKNFDTWNTKITLYLKVLSYEIDFENVDENWQILAFIRAAAGFWIFRRR